MILWMRVEYAVIAISLHRQVQVQKAIRDQISSALEKSL
jgi:hypothetical protein